jgi:NAD-dependent deacetylase
VTFIEKADVLIIGGTSMTVYPAAGLVHYYRGNKLVLINKSSTQYDSRANLIINESIGETLKEALLLQ